MKIFPTRTCALAALLSIGFVSGLSVATGQTSALERAVAHTRETVEARREREARELTVKKKLMRSVLVHFDAKPLREAVAELGKLADVKILLDPTGFFYEGISEDRPVSLDLSSEIMVKSYLNLILERDHLGYYIDGDTVHVTSEEWATEERFEVIDVTDCGDDMVKFLEVWCRTYRISPERFRVCRESGKVKFIISTSDDKGEIVAGILKEFPKVGQEHGEQPGNPDRKAELQPPP